MDSTINPSPLTTPLSATSPRFHIQGQRLHHLPGQLCHCSTTPSDKKFFLTSNIVQKNPFLTFQVPISSRMLQDEYQLFDIQWLKLTCATHRLTELCPFIATVIAKVLYRLHTAAPRCAPNPHRSVAFICSFFVPGRPHAVRNPRNATAPCYSAAAARWCRSAATDGRERTAGGDGAVI